MSPTHPAQSSSLSPPTRRRLQSDLRFEVSPMSPRVVEANEQLRHGGLRLPLVREVERLQQQHGDANAIARWPSPCSCFRTTVPNPHPGILLLLDYKLNFFVTYNATVLVKILQSLCTSMLVFFRDMESLMQCLTLWHHKLVSALVCFFVPNVLSYMKTEPQSILNCMPKKLKH